jgi:hypothetical protein
MIPLWDVNLSREMPVSLKALKIPVKYTECPGVSHNSWENAFADPNYLEWMFMQMRNAWTAVVGEENVRLAQWGVGARDRQLQ